MPAASSASTASPGGFAEASSNTAAAAAAAAYGPELERIPAARRAALVARAEALRRVRGVAATPLLSGGAISVPAELQCGLARARFRVFATLTDPTSLLGSAALVGMIATILISIAAFCVQTLPVFRVRDATGVSGEPERNFDLIDLAVTVIFTVEYVARLLTVSAAPTLEEADEMMAAAAAAAAAATATTAAAAATTTTTTTATAAGAAVAPAPVTFTETLVELVDGSPPQGPAPQREHPSELAYSRRSVLRSLALVLQWVLDPLNLVDLVAIAPYYVQLFVASSSVQLTFVRVLRLTRIIRLLKVIRGFSGVTVIVRTMAAASSALSFLLFMAALGVCLFGCLIFLCEGGKYDAATGLFLRENFSASGMEPTPFLSIPHSFWYALVTMATVGYGDFVPTSAAGRCIGALAIVFGVLMLSMPITVVCMSFANEFGKWQREENVRMAADRRESTRLALELFDVEEATAAAAAEAVAAARGSQGRAAGQLKATATGPAAPQTHAPAAAAAQAPPPSTVERLKRSASDTLVRGLSARFLLTLKSQAREQDPALPPPGDSVAPRADGGAEAPTLEADLASLREEVARLREQVATLPAAIAAALRGGGGGGGGGGGD